MSGKQNDEAPKTPEETLAESVDAVVQQNLLLIELAGVRGFNPVVALDYTANGAGLLIRRLFEAVGAFEEGTIPWRTTMGDLFRTTGSLIETLMGLKKAPVMELEAVAVAFRQCMILWSDTHSTPVMTRKTYLKKIFDGEADFCGKLKELHKAYLRIELSRGGRKRALSAADVKRRRRKGAGAERNRTALGDLRFCDEGGEDDARRHLFRADEGRFGRDMAEVLLRLAIRKTPPPASQTLPPKNDR